MLLKTLAYGLCFIASAELALIIAVSYNFSYAEFTCIKILTGLPLLAWIYHNVESRYSHSVASKKPYLYALASFILVFTIAPLLTLKQPIEAKNLLIAVVGAIYIASIEEYIFRISPFSTVAPTKYPTRKILLYSILFSVFHLVHIFHNQDITTTFVEAGVALGIGYYLSVLYLTFRKPAYPISLHSVINVFNLYTALNRNEIESSSLKLTFSPFKFDERLLVIVLSIIFFYYLAERLKSLNTVSQDHS